MSMYELNIAEIHLFCDDDFTSDKIKESMFSNIKLYSMNEKIV